MKDSKNTLKVMESKRQMRSLQDQISELRKQFKELKSQQEKKRVINLNSFEMTEEGKVLKTNGFCGFKTIRELKNDISVVPKYRGVYVVLLPKMNEKSFLDEGTGGYFKDKDPNVSIGELEQNWIENSCILYIGKAGGANSNATLQSRLKQYMDFGSGKPVGHWGGRYIWQLKNADDLIVCWNMTDREPSEVESEMIENFKKQHGGKRPFANLRD